MPVESAPLCSVRYFGRVTRLLPLHAVRQRLINRFAFTRLNLPPFKFGAG